MRDPLDPRGASLAWATLQLEGSVLELSEFLMFCMLLQILRE